VYLIAGFGSLLASLIITPIVRGLARRHGFVDKPDGRRKTHATAVALGGGAAVMVAATIAIVAAFAYGLQGGEVGLFARFDPRMLAMAVAAVLIVALGLVDDLIGMRGRTKLAGQIGIIALLLAAGYRIDGIGFAGTEIPLGYLAIPVTACWLIGTTNAVNLIDGIDGLAGSVGFILCLTMAAITGWMGHGIETTIMIALAGALLGFLRYNLAPASIYLGDAGSMLVGLMVGSVAITTSVKSSAAMAMAVPLAVWSIPILDTAAALLRRKLTGRSLFAPDRGHLHHSLLVRGWSVQQAQMFIALICATTCLSAVMSLYMGSEIIAIVTVIAVMLFLVFTRTFGHVEFALLANRVCKGVPLLDRLTATAGSRESSFQLQGSREWSKLWQAIVESADSHNLTRIKLTINIHSLHECFYATWDTSRPVDSDDERTWRVTHPLVVDGQSVGKLDLVGEVAGEGLSTPAQMIAALEFIEPIEDDIRAIRDKVVSETNQHSLLRHKALRPDSQPAGSLSATT
jgi:UDP-GlcNAc:undecaprenyl-phosphate GlcNAc-1-phosphate transferase